MNMNTFLRTDFVLCFFISGEEELISQAVVLKTSLDYARAQRLVWQGMPVSGWYQLQCKVQGTSTQYSKEEYQIKRSEEEEAF